MFYRFDVKEKEEKKIWNFYLQNLNEILEADVEKDMVARKEITLESVKQTMDEELVWIFYIVNLLHYQNLY